MNHSKIVLTSALAVLLVAGVLLVESFSASSTATAAAGGSGPVKPVPWKHA